MTLSVEGGGKDGVSGGKAVCAVVAKNHHKEVNTSRSNHWSSDKCLYFF